MHEVRGPKSKFSDTAGFSEKTPKFFFISNFLSKIEVFRTFLKIVSLDLAENPYLDRLDHYLQLSNWSHVQENSSSPLKNYFLFDFFGFLIKKIKKNRKTFIKHFFFAGQVPESSPKCSLYIVLTCGKKSKH